MDQSIISSDPAEITAFTAADRLWALAWGVVVAPAGWTVEADLKPAESIAPIVVFAPRQRRGLTKALRPEVGNGYLVTSTAGGVVVDDPGSGYAVQDQRTVATLREALLSLLPLSEAALARVDGLAG